MAVDVSLRRRAVHGTSVGEAKAHFVRSHSAHTHARCLQLLVKQWAKARGLIDPTAGRLNSFSWALMVIFFLQVRAPHLIASTGDDAEDASLTQAAKTSKSLANEQLKPEDAIFWDMLRTGCSRRGAAATLLETQLGALLSDFFAFWGAFDLCHVASVRLGRCVPAGGSELTQASRARVVSTDGRARLASLHPCSNERRGELLQKLLATYASRAAATVVGSLSMDS